MEQIITYSVSRGKIRGDEDENITKAIAEGYRIVDIIQTAADDHVVVTVLLTKAKSTTDWPIYYHLHRNQKG